MKKFPLVCLLSFSACLSLLANPAWAVRTAHTLSIRYQATLSVDPKRHAGVAFLIGKDASLGHFEDQLALQADSYRIVSMGQATGWIASFLPGDSWQRTSEGKVVRGTLHVARFTEQRGRHGVTSVVIDTAKKTATYSRGEQVLKEDPLPPKARLFDSANLPYFLLGRPMPKAPVSVSVLDGKSIKPFVFDIARDTVEVEGQAIPALKFTRRIVQPGDATYELWLRVEDGLPLRSRIGASAKYGAILEQRIQALPPVLR